LLAGLHLLEHNVWKPTLANHLQKVLTIKFAVHQDVIDVDEFLSRIQQVLGDLYAGLILPNWPFVRHNRYYIAD
jgi:hypothetical protein